MHLGKRIIFGSLASLISAQQTEGPDFSPSISFAYPPVEATGGARLTVNALDSVTLEWASNYDRAWLVLWCDEYKAEDGGRQTSNIWFRREVFPIGDYTYKPANSLDPSEFNRTGPYPYACHFDLQYNSERGRSGTAMNITSIENHSVATAFARLSTVTSNVSPASNTATSTSASTFATGPASSAATAISSSTAAPSGTPTKEGDDGLSAGAKAGIVVGVAGGVVLIAVVAYLFYQKSRKIKELKAQMAATEIVEAETVHPQTYYKYAQELEPGPPPELSDERHHAHELPVGK